MLSVLYVQCMLQNGHEIKPKFSIKIPICKAKFIDAITNYEVI